MDVDIKSEIEETDSLLDGDFSCQIYDYSSVNVELEQSGERDVSDQFPGGSGNCCKVCGDSATGMYFGALVCVPCKTFFLRYGGGSCIFECKFDKNCEITSTSRTQCKYCRYQKCIQAGMCRKVRPTQVHLNEGQQLCVVCNDVANGVHFGAITCEGCKKFFRRGLMEHNTYICKNEKKCLVNPRTRNSCRFCRYQKCLSAGMSREAIQMGRPSKVRNVNGSDCPRSKESKASKDGTDCGFTGLSDEWLKYYTDCALKNDVDKSNNGVTADSSGVGPVSRLAANGSKSSIKTNMKSGEGINVVSNITPFSFTVASGEIESRSNSSADDDRCTIVEPFELARSRNSARVSESYCSPMDTFGYAVAQKEKNLAKATELTNPDSLPLDNPHSVRNQFAVRSDSRLLAADNENPTGLLYSSNRWDNVPGTTGLNRTLSMSSGGYCELSANSLPFRQRAYSEQKGKSRPSGKYCSSDGNGVNGTTNQSDMEGSLNVITIDDDDKHSGPDCVLVRNGKTLHLNGDLKRKMVTSPVEIMSPLPRSSPELQICIPNKSSSLHRDAARNGNEMLRPFLCPLNVSSAAGDVYHSTTVSNLDSLPSYSSSVSDVSLTSPNSSSSRSTSFSSLSKRRRQPSDRDSPYCTIFALASSCQLFSEASKNPLVNDEEVNIFGSIYSEEQQKIVQKYWLEPNLPDENIIFNEKHKEIIKQILSAYERFVQTGTTINETLRKELENSRSSDVNASLPQWIQNKVVPVYTFSSITYCKSLPGFQDLATKDQASLIRLGQSQSRILVAANHWYDPKEKKFHDFLSWRSEDLFKKKLIKYAETIHSLELDRIESAVLNVLILMATDYPGLKNPDLIEESRQHFLSAFRAYTTAKYGTPNKRLENLFCHIPECRSLGFLHYKMTMTASLKAEEVEPNPQFPTR